MAKCPSLGECINKPWYIYMMNEATSMNKLGIKILTWLNLKDIMLGEKYVTIEYIHYKAL